MLNQKDIKLDAFKLIPEKIIKEEQIIPFDVEGAVIKVAIADPTKVMTMTKINAATRKSVAFFVVKFSEIDEILSSSIFQDAKAKPMTSGANSQSKGTSGIDPRLMGIQQKARQQAITGTNIPAFVDQIFQDALADGTSDIHIETFRDSAQIRFRSVQIIEGSLKKKLFLRTKKGVKLTKEGEL